MPNKWETIPLEKEEKGKWETIPLTPEEQAQYQPSDLSALDAYVAGGTQGLSSRFADELAAKLESLMGDQSYDEVYARKQKELEYLRAMYPAEMMASEAAGSIGGWMIPAGLLGKLGLKSKMAYDGIQGAVTGLGGSEQQLKDGLVQPAIDTVQGAAEGVIGGLAGRQIIAPLAKGAAKLAAPIVRPAVESAKAVAQKGLDAALKYSAPLLFNVPLEVAERAMKNPTIYKGSVGTAADVASQKIAPLANRVSAKIDADMAEATAALTDDFAMTPGEFTDKALEKFKAAKLVTTDPKTGKLSWRDAGAKAAWKAESKAAQDLAGEKGHLTQKELHEFYGMLKKNTKYGDNADTAASEAWKDIRKEVNKELLKNDDYKKPMLRVWSQTDDIEDFRKALNLVQSGDDAAGRYAADADKTARKAAAVSKKKEEVPADKVIDAFAEKYGNADERNLVAILKRVADEADLKAQWPSKSKLPGLGTISGGAAALTTLNPYLAAAGLARDIGGPPLWKAMATRASSAAPSWNLNLPGMPSLAPAAVNFATNPILGGDNPYATKAP
ncbi:MAG TPA: hypothetical protein VE954_43135 [Oligoflexus sp.]|uniref:hypothetical protein n=1 Tax=Oligoflexus sp. TaxID=1971216 RepID=UPI002D294E43|nr:hypothetical protein [Oligoflexus sp.]HYX39939.1 hypothetical protein [Oligoflexus sp.]